MFPGDKHLGDLNQHVLDLRIHVEKVISEEQSLSLQSVEQKKVLRQELEQSDAQKKVLEKQLVENETQKNELQKLLELRQTQTEYLEKELGHIGAQNQELRRELQKGEAQNEELSEVLKEKENQNEELKKVLLEHNTMLLKYEQEMNDHNKIFEQTIAQRIDLQKEVEELLNLRDHLKAVVLEQHRDLSKSEAKVKAFMRDLEQSEARNKELKKELEASERKRELEQQEMQLRKVNERVSLMKETADKLMPLLSEDLMLCHKEKEDLQRKYNELEKRLEQQEKNLQLMNSSGHPLTLGAQGLRVEAHLEVSNQDLGMEEPIISLKRKIGRPLGSQNKKGKKDLLPPLRVSLSIADGAKLWLQQTIDEEDEKLGSLKDELGVEAQRCIEYAREPERQEAFLWIRICVEYVIS